MLTQTPAPRVRRKYQQTKVPLRARRLETVTEGQRYRFVSVTGSVTVTVLKALNPVPGTERRAMVEVVKGNACYHPADKLYLPLRLLEEL